MKALKKFLIIILIMLLMFSYLSFVSNVSAMTITDLQGTDTTKLDDVGNGVITILSIVGSGLAIVFIICLGIKYMMGSLEERAQYKKTLLPYLIGAIFVFGASAISGLMYASFHV